MNRKLLILGAVLGFTAVLLGAFGAHGLQKIVEPAAVDSFETGVRYQMYHAFLALLVGGVFTISAKAKKTLFYLLLTGILLFSGSIYLLSTQAATGIDFTSIALLTPLGGLLLILGWGVLIVQFLKKKD
tara:strand:+ start:295 stop:681 length:387 start_codon:yes stop_codon:yes gene_type:complete